MWGWSFFGLSAAKIIEMMMILSSSGDGCLGFEDVIMDEVKDQDNYHNSHESYRTPAMNNALKGIDDVNPKVDDLKREFAKKEGETLTLSYKINVRMLGDPYLPFRSSLLT